MNLKQVHFDKMRTWYNNQTIMQVLYSFATGKYHVVDTDRKVTVCRSNTLTEGYEEARAYYDAMGDITAPEIRAYVERMQHETLCKLGLPGLGARQKETLGLIADICSDALGKDRYLD